MIEAYSIGVDVADNAAIPFNTVSLKKGCTVELSGPTSIQFNKCGIYMVTVDATAAASTTIQLYKNEVPQAQAQSTGTEVNFTTLVQVPESNNCCPCSAPTVCKIVNTTATTFNSANIVVTKVV